MDFHKSSPNLLFNNRHIIWQWFLYIHDGSSFFRPTQWFQRENQKDKRKKVPSFQGKQRGNRKYPILSISLSKYKWQLADLIWMDGPTSTVVVPTDTGPCRYEPCEEIGGATPHNDCFPFFHPLPFQVCIGTLIWWSGFFYINSPSKVGSTWLTARITNTEEEPYLNSYEF